MRARPSRRFRHRPWRRRPPAPRRKRPDRLGERGPGSAQPVARKGAEFGAEGGAAAPTRALPSREARWRRRNAEPGLPALGGSEWRATVVLPLQGGSALAWGSPFSMLPPRRDALDLGERVHRAVLRRLGQAHRCGLRPARVHSGFLPTERVSTIQSTQKKSRTRFQSRELTVESSSVVLESACALPPTSLPASARQRAPMI